ncbi:hypothetical protein H7170_03660 [Candidatus Gracilibacteria bacterium]|nr:hypothetical protein [Candidatus Gracilibacteria bacterium]
MQFFGFSALIFGLVIIAFPEFLAYLIGFFFLILGVNILLVSTLFRKGNPSTSQQSWKVGGYEILKNKK